MSRCRIRVRTVLLGAIAAGSLLSAATLPATAQSRETFGAPTSGAGRSQSSLTSDERDAGGLLAEGREHLARGNAVEGRRRLEVLVARYPDTAAADEARRELGRIYARQQPGSGERQGRSPPSLALSPADPRSDSGGALRQPTAPGSPISVAKAPSSDMDQAPGSLRATRAMQQEFRLNIGDRVFFGEASVELGSRARGVLAAQAQWLGRLPGVSILVEGHADEAGSNDYNRELALKRAQVVRARLIEEGIEPGRIAIATLGRGRPIANCTAADCAAHNRRAVTVLVGSPAEAMSPSFVPAHRSGPDARTGN